MERKILRMLQQVKSYWGFDRAHLHAIVHGSHESNFVLPKLIDLSSTFHSLGHAVRIFQSARSANVVACNMMIKCIVEKKLHIDAFSVYNEMRKVRDISPNNFTFTFLLKACEVSESLNWSRSVHAQIIRYGFGAYVFVQNAILNTYAKCNGQIDFARKVFDDMLERDVVSWNSIIGAFILHGDIKQAMVIFKLMPEKNLISWNSMIKGLAQMGDMAAAQLVFDQMPTRDNISWNIMISGYATKGDASSTARKIFDQMEHKDVYSWTSMISAYSKNGDLESAREMFNRMPVKNVVSWNAMIIGYNDNSQFHEALCMFQQMLLDEKFLPDEATLTGAISACAQLGSLDHGNWIHSYIKKSNVQPTIPLGNALIDMFAKCGDIETSRLVFNQMPNRCIITWTAMISGLAYNGEPEKALALFNKMSVEGYTQPDDVIFIAVLSACTHGGLVEEGKLIFDQMIAKYRIKPRSEHYGCMVDLLGRASRFEEAVEFIQSMPEDNVVLWATLLSSCVAHGAQRLIEFVSQKIIDLEPLSSCYQVLISNSVAVEGKWESVQNVRRYMHRKGIDKVPGCSLIQVGGEVHEFLVKDTKHKRSEEIYEVLNGLIEVMRHPNWLADLMYTTSATAD